MLGLIILYAIESSSERVCCQSNSIDNNDTLFIFILVDESELNGDVLHISTLIMQMSMIDLSVSSWK